MAIFSSCTLAHLLFATAAIFFRFYLLLPLYLLLAFRQSASSHGPPTYPIFGCLVSFYKNRKRLLDWYTELLAVSPTQTIVISRLGGRRTVVTANPKNIEYILKSNFNNFPKGKPFTEILGDLLGHGIFNVDGELWHMQRKLASHEFTAKSLREFLVQTLEIEVEERLLPILRSAAKDGRVVDLQELLRRFAFDIVSKVSLGMDPAYLDPSLPISYFARAFDVASMISARRAAAPIFAIWKVKRALNLGSERQLKEAIKEIHVSVTELINSRRAEKEGKERRDLLSRLISAVDDEKLIRDMVISFIMAGRDTTSSAMTWLFWLLSSHEELQKEIIEEVKTVTSKGGERLNYENLKEMRVVNACLCESMRLYPPVAWDSKHAAEEDRLPDGTRVERGDRVTYFPYGMGRMKGVWGEDCEAFKPQRWLESEECISPYKFPVFQAGPRVCLGKEMAFIQMKYVVAAILRRFEVKAVCEEPPVFLPLLTAHMAGGFKVVIRERNLQ